MMYEVVGTGAAPSFFSVDAVGRVYTRGLLRTDRALTYVVSKVGFVGKPLERSLCMHQYLNDQCSMCIYTELTRVYNIRAMTCDFQKCGILTGVYSDEPVQPPFKLRNSK